MKHAWILADRFLRAITRNDGKSRIDKQNLVPGIRYYYTFIDGIKYACEQTESLRGLLSFGNILDYLNKVIRLTGSCMG